MAPSSWSNAPSIKGLSYDMAAAKAELAKSSVPNGFTATISVNSGNSDENVMAQIVQAAVAPLGIKLTIQSLDPSALVDAKNAGNYEMGFGYDTTDIVDPDEIIRFTSVLNDGSTSLWSFYDNKEIADLAAKAVTISDQAKRQQIYFKIERIWNEDQPTVPMFYSPEVYAHAKNVHGFHPLVTRNCNQVDTWLSK